MRTLLLSLLALAACGSDTAPGPDGNTVVPRATWYQDVGPIMATHCMSCHQAGGIAPFALTDYDAAKENAMRALTQVDNGAMPPFDAREEADCTPRFNWKDDPRLSADEKTKLHQWVEDGFALGTEAQLPPIKNTDLPNKTLTIAPSTPFVSQGSRDQFMCFILDPKLAVGQWMTGLQVRPGNSKVVHHVVLSELQPGADTTALVTAHGIGSAWNCDQMNQPGFVINVWTPGNDPMQTPTDLAVPMVASSLVMMQIHYHPAGAVNDPDTTSIDMRFSQQWPKKMYFIAAFGNEFAAPNLLPDPDDVGGTPQFVIPKNKPDHIEHMRRQVPALGGLTNVAVYSVNAHMHLVGTHIAGKIERPTARGNDPQTECLANGGWNFDWQRTYIYDTSLDRLPTVQQGDVIDITCHWNNTIENPFVQRMLDDSHLPPTPVDITLGEQTTNEMCLEIFGLAVDAPPQPTGLVSGLPEGFRLPSALQTLPELR